MLHKHVYMWIIHAKQYVHMHIRIRQAKNWGIPLYKCRYFIKVSNIQHQISLILLKFYFFILKLFCFVNLWAGHKRTTPFKGLLNICSTINSTSNFFCSVYSIFVLLSIIYLIMLTDETFQTHTDSLIV